MEYFSFGSGERPFVMIPGASVTSVMPAEAAVSARYIQYGQTYTFYLFDYGQEMNRGDTPTVVADRIASQMEQLGLTGADVLGCSLGGMIAQNLAIRHPALVRKLVLGATIPENNEISRAVFEKWQALADSGNVVGLNRCVQEKVYSPAYYRQYRDAFAAQETAGTPEDLLHFSAQMDGCLSVDCYDEIEKIQCPVLVVGSWQDATLGYVGSIQIAEKLHCELILCASYGHAVFDESPDFIPRIMEFCMKD